ncbi:MAG: hypothetical protein HY369_00865 [Candidatus Aenigmarchaeota archaeon]|nr:hypothetical protein [Candidatus Aenigmarchaeota archaeon]
MAQRKGMSFTLQIIVTVVVILVVAFLLLTIFSGGIEQAQQQIAVWFGWANQPVNFPTDTTGLSGACTGTCVAGSCPAGKTALLGTCPTGQVCCSS